MPMVLFTLLVALVLQAVVLPESLRVWRPEFVLMCTLYWVIHVTPRFGMGAAWIVGMLLDVLTQSTFGVHGLSFLAAAALAWRNAVPLRMVGVAQSCLAMVGLLGLAIAVEQVALLVTGGSLSAGQWAPLLPSVVLWPLLAFVLQRLRNTLEVDT